MKTTVRSCSLFALCVALWAFPAWAAPTAYGKAAGAPSAVELARLPKFCWGQYDDSFRGPEFNLNKIPNCGVAMNHYCPALLYLMRSENPTAPEVRRIQWLKTAKGDTQYTITYMPPYCPLRSHAEATLVKVNARLATKK